MTSLRKEFVKDFTLKRNFLINWIFEPKVALQEDKKKEIIENVLFVAKRIGGFDEEILQKE